LSNAEGKGAAIKTFALRGRVVDGNRDWAFGTILVEGSTIKNVEPGSINADETIDLPADSILMPGFIDLQVNGAFGVDVATEPERLEKLSIELLKTGTTCYLPTLISLPLTDYPTLLPQISLGGGRGAIPLGLHLEGPFLHPEKRGAHPLSNIEPPSEGALEAMLGATSIRMITLAPEKEHAQELIDLAVSQGTLVSAGHSDASFVAANRAFDHGVTAVTHLFNAMRPLLSREPGLPGAALTYGPPVACGIIADGRHIHPNVVKLAFQALGPEYLYLITDSISAAGMGAGKYSLAGQVVSLEGGDAPRLGERPPAGSLENRPLAGSILTMNQALRNVMAFTGCSLGEAVRMATSTPAPLIGEEAARGRLVPGHRADIVALSPDLEVRKVWIGGEKRLG